ncbi:MAG: hypothetical protein HXY20_14450, partial [Acidobacteria bacterium]|nr:hypothetical protein [Acidobacteriota bacterium]
NGETDPFNAASFGEASAEADRTLTLTNDGGSDLTVTFQFNVELQARTQLGDPALERAAASASFDLEVDGVSQGLRVVNHDDPVPLLPWETPGAALGGLFRHLGAELRLTDRGTWELLPEHRAERYLLTSFAARLGRENPKEHEMARYLAKVEALAVTRAPFAEGRP